MGFLWPRLQTLRLQSGFFCHQIEQIKMNLYWAEIQFYGFFRLLVKLVLNWKQFYESQRSHNVKYKLKEENCQKK